MVAVTAIVSFELIALNNRFCLDPH